MSKSQRTAALRACLAAACMLLVSQVSAQNPTGALSGRVTDGSGAGLPRVTVTATSPNLQSSRTTNTATNGGYKLGSLPPGEYKVTYELEGFATAVRTLVVTAGQTRISDIDMKVAEVVEELIVTSNVDTISESNTASSTTQAEIESLPVNRTVLEAVNLAPGVSNTGPGSNITLSGGFTYENLYLINGVEVNENTRGSFLPLFIEDAIQETTTATSGISAEYGRFTGGVVNVITKSGGNEFSGSLRVDLTDDDWRTQTPLPDPGSNQMQGFDAVYSDALGGYVLKDRLWFFLAQRETDKTRVGVPNQSDKPFQFELQGKKVPVSPGYTVNFGFGADPDISVSRTDPQDIKTGNYTGILTPSFFVESQYSEKSFVFVNSQTVPFNFDWGNPGDVDNWTGALNQPDLDASAGFAPQSWPQPFSDQSDPQDRKSEQTAASLSYFLDAPSPGSHDLKVGFEDFTSIRTGGSEEAHETEGLRVVPSTQGMPNFQDASRFWLGDNPHGIDFNGLYVSDRWQLNDHWSFNIGVRYEDVSGDTTAAAGTASDAAFVPRLGASYDLRGDGKYRFDFSYAEYAGKYSEGQFAENTDAGSPSGLMTLFDDENASGGYLPNGFGTYGPFGPDNPISPAPGDGVVVRRGDLSAQTLFGVGPEGAATVDTEIYFGMRFYTDELLNKEHYDKALTDALGVAPGETFETFGQVTPLGDGGFAVNIGAEWNQRDGGGLFNNNQFQQLLGDAADNRLPEFALKNFNIIEGSWPYFPTVPKPPFPEPRPMSLPNDGHFHAAGSAVERIDDQWGLKRIGFKTAGRDGKGALWPRSGKPVIVAVVDSGIDIGHPDLRRQLWANFKEIPNNHKDDDGNGFVDDVIGWNFVDRNNDVRDLFGHGTFIAGIIGAATDNGIGIAGVNPWARLMAVKVGDFDGVSNNIDIAAGIAYAVDMGARVINVSFEGHKLSKAIQAAIDHAIARGALVIVAAGNEGVDAGGISPAGQGGVITVAAVNHDGQRESYSNWGAAVDIAAPGSDIVSLRAQKTDLLQFALDDYVPGANIIGERGALYHMSGTSFAAPYVAGVASLLWSVNPDLTAEQVKRMLLHSATDIDLPGLDNLTGYGLLDAAAALEADPAFFIEAGISGVGVVQKDGKPHVRVTGTVDADRFKRAWIELGRGENPDDWKKISRNIKRPVRDGALDDIEAKSFAGEKVWTLRAVVLHKNGREREFRFRLNLG